MILDKINGLVTLSLKRSLVMFNGLYFTLLGGDSMKRELRNWNNFPVFPHLFDDWDASFFNDRQSMKTDVIKKDNHYEMKMEVPGFDKKDIQIELVDGYLCVSANKTSETNEKDDKGTIVRQEMKKTIKEQSFVKSVVAIVAHVDSMLVKATNRKTSKQASKMVN